MKKIILSLLFLLVLTAQSFAYDFDVILTKERLQIQCIILSETDEQIVYRMLDAETPQYTLLKNDILKVYRANQEPETKAIESSTIAKNESSTPTLATKSIESSVTAMKLESQLSISESSLSESTPSSASADNDTIILENHIKIRDVYYNSNDNDIIILKDNTKIECVISEVSKTEIKYKKVNYADGPTFVESTEDIVTIFFRDGSVKSYLEGSEPSKSDVTISKDKSSSAASGILSDWSFQLNAELGSHFTRNSYSYLDYPSGGFDIEASFGLRFSKYIFAGLGIGFNSEFSNSTQRTLDTTYPFNFTFISLPLFVDTRFYLPTKVDVNPFFLASIGGYIGVQTKTPVTMNGVIYDPLKPGEVYRSYDHLFNPMIFSNGGYLMSLGVGFEYKYFQLSTGYRLMAGGGSTGNYGFIKLGICYSNQISTRRNSREKTISKPIPRKDLPRMKF